MQIAVLYARCVPQGVGFSERVADDDWDDLFVAAAVRAQAGGDA